MQFELFFGREFAALRQAAVEHGPTVLELGCGEGALSVDLARRGLSVTGIDLSPERIKQATETAAREGVSGRTMFQVSDLNTTNLPADTYTCIVAHDSLHHILELDHLLDQVRNALREGGAFLVMDYRGMGTLRRIAAASLTALLPTYLPYRDKWSKRRRLRAFLATETEKRRAVQGGTENLLHPESPFEEISQNSIVPEIFQRFTVNHYHSYLPFWFYLAPKVRVPGFLRTPWFRFMRRLDSLGAMVGLEGAYFYLEASKESDASASR